MKSILNKSAVERYSRQIILKNIGPVGQKKIIKSKVLIIGAGGLGFPVIDYLTRAGVGNIGIIDHDNVDISNIHRQSLYNTKDIGKFRIVFSPLGMAWKCYVVKKGYKDGYVGLIFSLCMGIYSFLRLV